MTSIESSRRIWCAGSDENAKDTFMRFRGECTVPAAADAELLVSADTEFTLFLNGKRIPASQFPDYPEEKTFARIPVRLNRGRNVFCVLVWHWGEGMSTHKVCPGGLRFACESEGKTLLVSSEAWKSSPSNAFTSGRAIRVTAQLGLCFEYDAHKDDSWTEPDYDDSAWKNAPVLPCPDPSGAWAGLRERPIPLLEELPPKPVRLVQQGEVFDPESVNPFIRPVFFGDLFENRPDYPVKFEDTAFYNEFPVLSPGGKAWKFKVPEKAGGVFATVDLGLESVGYLRLEVEAAAGTVVEIHHGEHLDDGRVRSNISGRCFIDTYLCREGRNMFFFPMRRLGLRYLQLFFRNFGKNAPAIAYAGISEVIFPLPEAAEFHSDDRLDARLRELSIRTLRCCMHDHYEDCPWREQSLYAYDSRNQILYGYYLWGNFRFAEASLRLLGKGYFPELGNLSLCAPSGHELTIPAFTFVWISELYEHMLFSGETALCRDELPTVDAILDSARKRKSSVPGLYEPARDKRIWNFFEWVGTLGACDGGVHSLYNLYLLEALRSASKLHEAIGDKPGARRCSEAASALAERVNELFWNEKKGVYDLYLDKADQPVYEHVQIMALWLGIAPEQRKRRVLESILSGRMIPVTFSALSYFVRALMRETPEARVFAEQRLKKDFEPLVFAGATSLWETSNGANDFMKAGSLCHAWSSIPAYFDGAVTLGVTPLKPGFAEFEVKVCPGTLSKASGTVPTPHGSISVSWERLPDGLHVKVSAPKGCRAVCAAYPEFPVKEFRLGKTL